MEINTALRMHQVELDEALSMLHKYLTPIIERFYGQLPQPALSFEETRPGNVCSYREKDGLALYYRINLNSLYAHRLLSDHLMVVTHGCGHLWQHIYGKPAELPYHNKAFRTKMLEIGIPCGSRGHSLGMQEPFVSFLKELGVEAQVLPFKHAQLVRTSRPGSRLKPWKCKCTRVWASGGVKVEALCLKCSREFQRQ